MTVKGVDVASYQSITFDAAGLGFVIVKATEGVTYVNPKYKAQVAHARAEGLIVGHYHFGRPGPMAPQLAFFLSHIDLHPGDLIAFDWEDPGVPCDDKDAWIEGAQAKEPAHRVLLYCNLTYWLDRDTTSNCGDGLWIADPDAEIGHPRVEHAWTLHQYSSAGGLDRNAANFADLGAMKTWAAKGAKPPATKPKPTTKPRVDLSNLVAAAHTDPKAKQGHQTHAADVRIVEAALKAEGLLPARYAGDGSFGTTTVLAYAAWQRHLGYVGHDADGIPGQKSLAALGKKHGFTVTS